METKRDRAGRTIAAIFVCVFLIYFSSVFYGSSQGAYDRADAALRLASISSVFPDADEAASPIFTLLSLLPLAFAALYALGIKWSGRVFVASFAAYVLSPVFFNFDGVEIYASIDILGEAILFALGGMLSLQIVTFERNATALTGQEADAGT